MMRPTFVLTKMVEDKTTLVDVVMKSTRQRSLTMVDDNNAVLLNETRISTRDRRNAGSCQLTLLASRSGAGCLSAGLKPPCFSSMTASKSSLNVFTHTHSVTHSVTQTDTQEPALSDSLRLTVYTSRHQPVRPSLIICHIAIACSMAQIMTSVCVCQSLSLSVYLSVCEHSHGRISRSIFTKIGTDVRTPKEKRVR